MIRYGQTNQQFPINIVDGSKFGIYPKISAEKTYNMFCSDNWLINYPGYKSIAEGLGLNGRGIITSANFDQMVAVIGQNVYAFSVEYDQNAFPQYHAVTQLVGRLNTFTSDVFMAENNNGQILISDKSNLYVYEPAGPTLFQQLSIDFIPGAVCYHDSRFIVAALGTNTWRLSDLNGITFTNAAQFVGTLQTKSDKVVAVVPIPSKGNAILVFGSICTEAWFDVGFQLFPYQRNSSMNFDYGCMNPASIAFTDEVVVWLARNEKSGPIFMFSDGGSPQKISSDGIDHFLSNMANPQDVEAFIYRQDGHLFYHANFYTENVSLFYDFTTQKFFHACDEHGDYFIAKQVAFLNNQYYFVSRKDGKLYALDTIYTTYDGQEIPRIRVCQSIRLPTQDFGVVTSAGFTIEQGTTEPLMQPFPIEEVLITQDANILITQDGHGLIAQTQYEYRPTYPRVDLTFAVDGGESFSHPCPYTLNPLGKRQNKLMWWQLGLANDWTPQFRFWGMGRFVCTDGYANIRF